MRAWPSPVLVFLVAAACGGGDGRGASPRAAARGAPDAATAGAPADAAPVVAGFVRVESALADGSSWRQAPAGELVGHMDNVGAFICKVATRFGPLDEALRLRADAPVVVGVVLRHAATGVIIVPHIGEGVGWGYAGGFIYTEGKGLWDDPEWRFTPPAFPEVARELDELLARTTPADCAVTYSGGIRANRAGVKQGVPFFEHLGAREGLDVRLRLFDGLDAYPASGRARVERELCDRALFTWQEAREAGGDVLAGYASHDALRVRLDRCVETGVAELEAEITADEFDVDAAPENVAYWLGVVRDPELGNADLRRRLERLRATVTAAKRGR